MNRSSLHKILLGITRGLLETTTDLTLFVLYLMITSPGLSLKRDIFDAFYESSELLNKINYETISRSLTQLAQKSLVRLGQRKDRSITITPTGQEAVKRLLPIYRKQRHWDQKIYLITYDIPEQKKRSRDLLRRFLKRENTASLQRSVFLSPYNLRQKIARFMGDHRLVGTILVSELDRRGMIGNYNLTQLIRRLYNLDKINVSYGEFIQKWQNPPSHFDPLSLHCEFLTILKKDPQLPYELLPSNFLGKQAFQLYNSLTNYIPGKRSLRQYVVKSS